MSKQPRSASRGREVFQSTGRGGAGNIQRAINPAEARSEVATDDVPSPRGRELPASPAPKLTTTGRGGAGNTQLASQITAADASFTETELEVLSEHIISQENTNQSTGRGGLGNFAPRSRSREPLSARVLYGGGRGGGGNVYTNEAPSPGRTDNNTMPRSRSREPSSARVLYAGGRGGAGNIYSGEASSISVIDEEERKKVANSLDRNGEGFHSTGRGGSANFRTGQEPPVERPSQSNPEYESTGRGGSGNFVYSENGTPSRRRE